MRADESTKISLDERGLFAVIAGVFGKPSNPMLGSYASKIHKTKHGYNAKVNFTPPLLMLLGMGWKSLEWRFFDEQPDRGYAKMRAVVVDRDFVCTNKCDCQSLLEDFNKFRGGGVTIW